MRMAFLCVLMGRTTVFSNSTLRQTKGAVTASLYPIITPKQGTTKHNLYHPLPKTSQDVSSKKKTLLRFFFPMFFVWRALQPKNNNQPSTDRKSGHQLHRGYGYIDTSDWYMVGFKIPRMPSGNFKFKAFPMEISMVSFCAWKKQNKLRWGEVEMFNKNKEPWKMWVCFFFSVSFSCLWVRVFMIMFLLGEGNGVDTVLKSSDISFFVLGKWQIG